MRRSTVVTAQSAARSAARLLAHLAQDGAQARSDTGSTDRVLLSRRSRGVSIGAGSVPIAAAQDLIEAGSCVWRLPNCDGSRDLVLTADGAAHQRRQAAIDIANPSLDTPSPFRTQHGGIVIEPVLHGDERTARHVNAAESPLSWLHRRKGSDGRPLIDAVCLQAGERLRIDLTRAAMLPRTGANWDVGAVSGSGARDPAGAADAVIAARQRARAALASVGDDLAGLLIDVCGFLTPLQDVERRRGWPARSSKIVLEIALRRLAAHYGLEVEARGPDRSCGLSHWGTDDYRPVIA